MRFNMGFSFLNKMGFKKGTASIVVGAILINQTLFASGVDGGFWAERRSVQRRQSQRSGGGLLAQAQVPQGWGAVPFNATLPSVEKVAFQSKSFGAALRSLSPQLTEIYREIFAALPSPHMTIRKLTLPSHGAPRGIVYYIQDVHRNREAQQNIARTITGLMEDPSVGPRLTLLGLEGAFKTYDFSYLRSFPEPAAAQVAAEDLLFQHEMSGPIYSILTTTGPIPAVVGVDDSLHYNANVEAYRRALPNQAGQKAQVLNRRADIESRKTRIFNSALLEFDQQVQAYQRGELALGAYAKALAKAKDVPLGGALKPFILALGLEESLDLKKVEAERILLLKTLAARLDRSRVDALMVHSVAYRSGEVSYGDFYRWLTSFCSQAGVRLSDFPALERYVRYVLAAEGLDAESLFHDLNQWEKDIYSARAKTREETDLIGDSRNLTLVEKLLNFSLTPEEWAEYHTGREGRGLDLEPYETFYREAHARDEAMTDRFVQTAVKTSLPGASEKPPLSILVTGGYHSPGVTARLANAGMAVISVVPKIKTVDTTQGPDYLSVFAQEKTPLDRLFEGSKLFVADNPLSANAAARQILSASVLSTQPGKDFSQKIREFLSRKFEGVSLSWNGILAQIRFLKNGENYFFTVNPTSEPGDKTHSLQESLSIGARIRVGGDHAVKWVKRTISGLFGVSQPLAGTIENTKKYFFLLPISTKGPVEDLRTPIVGVSASGEAIETLTKRVLSVRSSRGPPRLDLSIDGRLYRLPTLRAYQFTDQEFDAFFKHPETVRAPLVLDLNFPSGCSASCVYCFTEAGKTPHEIRFNAKATQPKLGPHDTVQIIRQYAAEGGRVLFLCSEGEPLMNPKKFLELAKLAKSVGLRVITFTNMTTITPNFAGELRKADVSLVVKLEHLNPKLNSAIIRPAKDYRYVSWKGQQVPQAFVDLWDAYEGSHDMLALSSMVTQKNVDNLLDIRQWAFDVLGIAHFIKKVNFYGFAEKNRSELELTLPETQAFERSLYAFDEKYGFSYPEDLPDAYSFDVRRFLNNSINAKGFPVRMYFHPRDGSYHSAGLVEPTFAVSPQVELNIRNAEGKIDLGNFFRKIQAVIGLYRSLLERTEDQFWEDVHAGGTTEEGRVRRNQRREAAYQASHALGEFLDAHWGDLDFRQRHQFLDLFDLSKRLARESSLFIVPDSPGLYRVDQADIRKARPRGEEFMFFSLHRKYPFYLAPYQITYAVTPPHHEQDIHGHFSTRELTISLGEKMYFKVFRFLNGKVAHEEKVPVEKYQGTDYGPGTPHLVGNDGEIPVPNITVKFGQGVVDRWSLAEGPSEDQYTFDRTVKSPVISAFGDAVLYSFRKPHLTSMIFELAPGQSMPMPFLEEKERGLFAVQGNVEARDSIEKISVSEGDILYGIQRDSGESPVVTNTGKGPAILFGVRLDENEHMVLQYPERRWKGMDETILPLGVGTIWMGRQWPEGDSSYTEPSASEIENILNGAFGLTAGSADRLMIDTAAGYGHSEQHLGGYFRSHPSEFARALIGTKWGVRFDPETGQSTLDHSANNLNISLANSFTNLGRVDIFYIHGTTSEVLRDKSVWTRMREIKEKGEGGIHFLGVSLSNRNAESVLTELLTSPYLNLVNVVQMPGETLLRRPDLVSLLKSKGIAIVAHSPMRSIAEGPPVEKYRALLGNGSSPVVLTGARSHFNETLHYVIDDEGQTKRPELDSLLSRFLRNKEAMAPSQTMGVWRAGRWLNDFLGAPVYETGIFFLAPFLMGSHLGLGLGLMAFLGVHFWDDYQGARETGLSLPEAYRRTVGSLVPRILRAGVLYALPFVLFDPGNWMGSDVLISFFFESHYHTALGVSLLHSARNGFAALSRWGGAINIQCLKWNGKSMVGLFAVLAPQLAWAGLTGSGDNGLLFDWLTTGGGTVIFVSVWLLIGLQVSSLFGRVVGNADELYWINRVKRVGLPHEREDVLLGAAAIQAENFETALTALLATRHVDVVARKVIKFLRKIGQEDRAQAIETRLASNAGGPVLGVHEKSESVRANARRMAYVVSGQGDLVRKNLTEGQREILDLFIHTFPHPDWFRLDSLDPQSLPLGLIRSVGEDLSDLKDNQVFDESFKAGLVDSNRGPLLATNVLQRLRQFADSNPYPMVSAEEESRFPVEMQLVTMADMGLVQDTLTRLQSINADESGKVYLLLMGADQATVGAIQKMAKGIPFVGIGPKPIAHVVAGQSSPRVNPTKLGQQYNDVRKKLGLTKEINLAVSVSEDVVFSNEEMKNVRGLDEVLKAALLRYLTSLPLRLADFNTMLRVVEKIKESA